MKAIIFDCFGVLATDIWLAFCDSLPASADLQRASDLNKAYDHGMITRQEFLTQVHDATGQYPPDIELLSQSQLGKNTALLDFMKTLKPAYKIGLLSNISSDWITEELLSADDQRLFDDMVFSHKVGLTKPDPRIYQLACDRLGVLPNEAIMVDDRAGYIDAARSFGMHGITYANLAQFRSELAALLDTNK